MLLMHESEMLSLLESARTHAPISKVSHSWASRAFRLPSVSGLVRSRWYGLLPLNTVEYHRSTSGTCSRPNV